MSVWFVWIGVTVHGLSLSSFLISSYFENSHSMLSRASQLPLLNDHKSCSYNIVFKLMSQYSIVDIYNLSQFVIIQDNHPFPPVIPISYLTHLNSIRIGCFPERWELILNVMTCEHINISIIGLYRLTWQYKRWKSMYLYMNLRKIFMNLVIYKQNKLILLMVALKKYGGVIFV